MSKTPVKIGLIPGDRPVFSTVWALRMRDRCTEALKKIKGVEWVLPDAVITTQGLVRSVEQAQRVASQFKKQEVERVLLGTMNFGDEEAMTEVARLLNVPTLLFGTPDAVLATGKRAGSDSFCGTLSVGLNLHVAGVPFSFAGILAPEDPRFIKAVKKFIATPTAKLTREHATAFKEKYAAPKANAKIKEAGKKAAADFREARLGQFGPRASGFVTCAYDERQLLRHFGQRVVPIDLAQVFGKANRLDDNDAAVQAAKARITSSAKIEVADGTVMKMAKLYVTLKALLGENQLCAAGHNCWTSIQTEYGISGCAVFSMLEEDGYPITCETDVYGAASMLLQQSVAKQAGSAAKPFFMDWTIQHPEDANLFQAWHCGKAPLSVFKNKPTVRAHEILTPLIGENISGGTLEGEFVAGPVTLVRLMEYNGKFRALVTRGVIEPSQWKEMRGSWGWVRMHDLDGLYHTLIEKGFSHHVSMIHGDHAALTASACEALGVDVVWVK